jgi:predicted AlkP superfamily phosphohydrolase/phosphomutase
VPASTSTATLANAPEARPLRPVLVLALDGATFDVIEPLVARGGLPNLARWMKEGRHAPLPSTVPPVTFPAWSSFMTGLEPGDHGIFDFTQKLPGAYRIRFVNASDRPAPTIFDRTHEAGGRVLVLGMPATFPPPGAEALSGLLVCGFDAPVSTQTDPRSASDPALYARIARHAGPWMRPDLDEGARASDFHERAVETLLARIDRKRGFALEALHQMRAAGQWPDLVTIVFSESDTVGHHYWRDHDPDSPRHDPGASAARRGAIEAVYERLDQACGEIRRAYGEDALCLVVSDHGMGPAADCVVHLNAFLAERGLLVRSTSTGRTLDAWARRARDLALRIVPAGLAQRIFRNARGAAARLESAARFGGLDWSRTLAFSEEANTQPGIWLNLAGREARGCIVPSDYEATRDRVIDALLDWKGPGGEPVIARALRREDVYAGPHLERAPDIVVELARPGGHGLSLVPTPWPGGDAIPPSVTQLHGEALGGGRGRGMNGTHRSNGIFIAHGPDETIEALPWPAKLSQVAASIAAGLGLAWNPGDTGADALAAPRTDYTEEEDAMVAERLRALGYLE